jgi:7,8-dihydropterin-6-yl-methyl-4-(beta-D-ribofuranosyl)aminobenzene 5'-phosphate synthase
MLRITTLCDNTAGMGDFIGEWGLSILVETDETTILMDTGADSAALRNAETLGVDFNKINRIVLSHGHSDHTGGLRGVLRKMRKEVEIIAHPDIWQLKYSKRGDKPAGYIGIPFREELLENLGARFILPKDSVQLTDSIRTTGEVPMVNEFEAVDSHLFVKEGTSLVPDQVMDDLALIMDTKEGLVIILGCAHRGMINTLYHAQQLTGTKQIHAVIGGSHLVGTSDERLWQTISALQELNVQKLALCHCTDLPVISVLAREFGERFIFNKSGTILNFS